jgi:hypothetical protein
MSRLNDFARSVLSMHAASLSLVLALLIGNAIAAPAPASAEDSKVNGAADNAVPAAASAENTTIETDSATYAIKRIELRGTSMTDADLAGLLDSKSQVSIVERFSKLSAAEVFIPELTITTKSEPAQKVLYRNIKLLDVQQGKAAAADIEASHFSVSDAKKNSIEGSYGHIHAQGIDLVLASHVMSETRKDEAEPLKKLYDNFSIEGFRIDILGKEPVSMTIGTMIGRNVKTRAFAVHSSDLQTVTDDQTQLTSLVRDFFTSIEMEEMTGNDIELKSRSEGRPLAVSLGKMSISKLGDSKIADIDFGSFTMKVQGAAIKIKDIDFKAIDFQKLRNAPVKTAVSDAQSKTGGADSKIEDSQQAAVLVPAVSQFIVSKIDVSLDESKKASENAQSDFLIDHFEVDGGMPLDSKPTQVTATLDHFTLDLKSFKDADLRPIVEMGYAKVDLSSRIEMAWNASTESLDIKDVSVSGLDMGAVKVTGLIDNVSKDFFSGDSTAMQAAAFGALIKKVEIRINNGGLFERAMAMQAKVQNKPVEEIKQSYVTTAAIGIPAMLDNKPASKIIGAALAKFVANPKSFHLTAVSSDGLGAADFALAKDPASILDSLDIKAVANE